VRSVLPPPSWFRLDAQMPDHDYHHGPIEMLRGRRLFSSTWTCFDVCYRYIRRRWMLSSRGEWWGHHSNYLSYLLF